MKARCGSVTARNCEALSEGVERDALYEQLVAKQYDNGRAIRMAETLEIDAVIDPARTRSWLAKGLASTKVGAGGQRFVDTW